MGCCTGRCFLITLCILQFVATVERQVFDFLGYMWAPIIGNFLQIIFVIIGFFGTLQYRPKILVVYTIWSLLWIGWNVFIICYYLELGILSRDMSILNLGTDNRSWWLDHGLGCQVVNASSSSTSSSSSSLTRRASPEEGDVVGCLLPYQYVEVIHAGVQCLLGLLGFCVACYVICVFSEEDDSSQPVHDELEYIKMRYRSPARNSFRTNRAYDTLTTTRSTYTTAERSTAEHQYSDDSADRYLDRHGDKQRVLKPDTWPETGGQTEIPFSISGQTPGLTVV